MYNEEILDHFMNPRNIGEIEKPDAFCTVGNDKCGEVMKLYLKIKDNVITDFKYITYGCGSSVAVASMTSERVIGKTLDDALKIVTDTDKNDEYNAIRMHCGVLIEDAVKLAIKNYKEN